MPDPNLGYNNRNSTSIDTFNQWFRARPEYYAKLAQFGQDPNNVHLNDAQKQEMVKLAQSLGAQVDEGGDGQEVDDSGNFRAKSHKLKNGLIIAGIAGAALLTAGAAGAFAGAAAPGAAGAGLGGVEAGAASGLGAAASSGAALGGMATLPALGAGTAAATGAGAGLAGLASGLGPEGVAEGTGVAGLTGSALPELGGEAGTIAGSGLPAAGSGVLGTASKIAGLADKVGNLANATGTAINGQDPDLAGIGAANAAAQAAKNRIAAAQVDQGGPTADKTALSNVRQAGLIGNFKDTAPNDYGSPGIVLGDKTRTFANQMQQALQDRLNAGKSLTLSGVPDPTAQELADAERARQASLGKTGNSTLDAINSASRIAKLAPGYINTAKSIWDLFK